MSRLSRLQRRRGSTAIAVGLVLACCSQPQPPRAASAPAAPAQASASSTAPATAKSEVKRVLVAQADLAEMPGFESRLYLIEYPPGVQAPLHVHTEQCTGYVLDGRFESAFADAPPTVTEAGQGFVELAHQPHRFRNPDAERTLHFVVTGTFRKGEPLFRALPGAPAFSSEALPRAANAFPTSNTVAGAPEIKRSLLAQREISDMPGLESRLYLIEFPPGSAAPTHIHTAQGIGYVLEGSFESAFGDEPAKVKHAGEGFIDTPGQDHHFRNLDSAHWLRFVFAGTFRQGEAPFRVVPKPHD